MLDLSRPISTRAGLAVRVICTDSRARSGPLAVLISDGPRELLRSYPLTGEVPASYGEATRRPTGNVLDLINVRVKVKRWRVKYEVDPELQRAPVLYTSSQLALNCNTTTNGSMHPDVVAIELIDVYEDEL